jgi:hypothetical protein
LGGGSLCLSVGLGMGSHVGANIAHRGEPAVSVQNISSCRNGLGLWAPALQSIFYNSKQGNRISLSQGLGVYSMNKARVDWECRVEKQLQSIFPVLLWQSSITTGTGVRCNCNLFMAYSSLQHVHKYFDQDVRADSRAAETVHNRWFKIFIVFLLSSILVWQWECFHIKLNCENENNFDRAKIISQFRISNIFSLILI